MGFGTCLADLESKQGRGGHKKFTLLESKLQLGGRSLAQIFGEMFKVQPLASRTGRPNCMLSSAVGVNNRIVQVIQDELPKVFCKRLVHEAAVKGW